MTEVVETQEVDTSEAEFTQGFTDARADEAPVVEKTEEKPQEAAPAKAEEKPAEQPAAAPTLIAGMTEADWNAAVAKAVDAEGIRNEIRKSFGQYGELNRSLQELKTKLAAGAPGTARKTITAAMLKRVNEELPGLGDALAQDLSEVLGAAEAAEQKAEQQGKSFDPDVYFTQKLAPALEQLEARANERAEMRIVKSIHRDFDTVVKSPDFAAWLKTLPQERQKEVRDSNDGFVAADAVTEFKGYADKQKKAKDQKKTRLETAVTPQGAAKAGGPVQQDEEAEFSTGFSTAGKKYAAR